MTDASDRLYGNTGLYLTLTKVSGGSTAFVADKDLKKAELNPEDADDDDLTFAEAATGDTKKFQLDLTALQSTAATSLHSFLWDNPGEEFNAVVGFHGNAIPTAAKPHLSFKCKADGRPKLGGEATREKKGKDFDYSMEVTSPLVKLTGV